MRFRTVFVRTLSCASSVCLAGLSGACGGSDALGPPRAGTATVLSGDEQVGTVGRPLPQPVAVRVADDGGHAVASVPVTWVVVAGGGTSGASPSMTDENGRAETIWVLGTAAGRHRLEARVAGLTPLVFEATALADAPVSATATGGQDQRAQPGATLPEALVVTVRDEFGNPVEGVSVTFSIAAGAGSLSVTESVTDVAGTAATSWTLGASMGTQAARATVPGVGVVRFTALLIGSLDLWLADHPAVSSSIVWEDEDRFALRYEDWTPARRASLADRYNLAQSGSFALEDPPVNQVAGALADSDYPYTGLTADDAWALWSAHVAQALWLERNGEVGWSLEGLPEAELRTLLDGRSMFHRPRSPVEATIGPDLYFVEGRVLPAPPDVVLRFMQAEGLLRPTRGETITAVVDWARRSMAHFLYAFQAQNAYDHWHSRGVVPATRIIEGTTRLPPLYPTYSHWTAGCHGTNHFLQVVLRAVNIPVEYHVAAGHATPRFPTEGLWLSHGDDPYTALVRNPILFSTNELFIDDATREAWFGLHLTREQQLDNVGRRPVELALRYPATFYVMWRRCWDLERGTAAEESEVFTIFGRHFSLEQLDAEGLWERLDGAIAARGGCGTFPPTPGS